MKRFLLGFALALFVACGDDDSSFAPRDEDSSSSVTPQSSESETSVSSSSKNGDAGTESGMTSSSAKSSSSMEQGDGGSEAAMTSSSKQSSSSKKVESSSSSLRLSSANLSSSSKKVESSSSEKNSVLSSSRDYRPYAHDTCLAGNRNYKSSDYKTFVDPRNGRSYYYYTATSNRTGKSITVMAENLNIGEMVLGENDQNDDSKIERYCYNNDTTYCDHYGGLYQWAEMMQLPSRCNTESCAELIQENHRGICPEGWRLFTWDDYVVIRQYKDDFDEGIAGLRSQCFTGYNTSGFSLIGGGLRDPDNGYFRGKEVSYWMYPEEHDYDKSTVAHDGSISSLVDSSPTKESGVIKLFGLSVRCTKLE